MGDLGRIDVIPQGNQSQINLLNPLRVNPNVHYL